MGMKFRRNGELPLLSTVGAGSAVFFNTVYHFHSTNKAVWLLSFLFQEVIYPSASYLITDTVSPVKDVRFYLQINMLDWQVPKPQYP